MIIFDKKINLQIMGPFCVAGGVVTLALLTEIELVDWKMTPED